MHSLLVLYQSKGYHTSPPNLKWKKKHICQVLRLGKKKKNQKKHSSYYVVQQLLIIFVAFKDVSFSFQLPLHYFATSHRDSKST